MARTKRVEFGMNMIKNLLLIITLAFVATACQRADRMIEKNLGQADAPLPDVIEPVAKPVAEPVLETADEVLKERTLMDTRQPKKKGGYKATLFPKSKSTRDEGTAFKLSW